MVAVEESERQGEGGGVSGSWESEKETASMLGRAFERTPGLCDVGQVPSSTSVLALDMIRVFDNFDVLEISKKGV